MEPTENVRESMQQDMVHRFREEIARQENGPRLRYRDYLRNKGNGDACREPLLGPTQIILPLE
ncbi:hypothetical protein JKG47_10275 [Acidithiobacillus sp. MC6.1]|nr:hypothetical protein [Acidithiobacillus sp. MC6.1]